MKKKRPWITVCEMTEDYKSCKEKLDAAKELLARKQHEVEQAKAPLRWALPLIHCQILERVGMGFASTLVVIMNLMVPSRSVTADADGSSLEQAVPSA